MFGERESTCLVANEKPRQQTTKYAINIFRRHRISNFSQKNFMFPQKISINPILKSTIITAGIQPIGHSIRTLLGTLIKTKGLISKKSILTVISADIIFDNLKFCLLHNEYILAVICQNNISNNKKYICQLNCF